MDGPTSQNLATSPAELRNLCTLEFESKLWAASTIEAIRWMIRQTDEYQKLCRGLKDETVNEAAIRRFVSSLLVSFRLGDRFQHEMALAALAVAFEEVRSSTANDYLEELARLRLVELTIASQLARQALSQRTVFSQTKVFAYDIEELDTGQHVSHVAPPRRALNGRTTISMEPSHA
jgi:N-glycosylase/DNA lyase